MFVNNVMVLNLCLLKNNMADINNQIVSKLKENSRTPFLTIANELKISEGTVRQRVKKLQQEGKIKKFTIETSTETALVGVRIKPQTKIDLLSKKLFQFGKLKIFHVSGKFDLVLLVDFLPKELNVFLDKIRLMKEIVETETFMILEEGS
jgi:Lrp/AsnC family transcriptional regulator, regulator for asnA, asnC and gidA